MEGKFLDNLVLLVKNNSLMWKIEPKTSLDSDGEYKISCLGPDNKTLLLVKFEKDKISFIKVTNKELKIDSLLFKNKFPQISIIEPILYNLFKDKFNELNKKEEESEEEKWNKLTQTFDIQSIRDIKLEDILKK